MLSPVEYAIALPLLVVAAGFDVGLRRIPNQLTVAIAAMGIAASWWRGGAAGLLSASGAAILIAFFLLFAWRARAIGGGDLKLAAAAGAWLGMERLWSFAIASAIAGGVLAAVCFVLSSRAVKREIAANVSLAVHGAMPPVTIGRGGGRVSVPYGAGIAAAALWVLARGS